MLKFSKLHVYTIAVKHFLTSRPGMIRFMFPVEHETSLLHLRMIRVLCIRPDADHYWWSFKQSVGMAAVTLFQLYGTIKLKSNFVCLKIESKIGCCPCDCENCKI